MNQNKWLYKIEKCVENQNKWRGSETLNMIASENLMSSKAKNVMENDFEHRYAEGLVGKRAYQGQKYQDEIEQMVIDLTKKLFKCDFVDSRCPTATTANLALFCGLMKPGDNYFSLQLPHGAHISFRKFGGAGCRNLNIHNIPYDEKKFNIDTEAFIEKILKYKPKLITLGGSVFLFPHPVKEIAEVCKDTNTIIHYDGSHVLGLIAGGEFQDPLTEGADILLGSTHKTFPGPQGALIMANDKSLDKKKKMYKKIRNAIFPGLVSNHHLWRFPPLAIALLEMLKYGKEYAEQTIKNAKSLAQNLDSYGFEVLAKDLGYTKSHQVLVDVSSFGGGAIIAKKLENANIISNKNTLFKDDVKTALKNPSGLRLGTQELTRIGMKEKDMKEVAKFYKRLIIEKENVEQIKIAVTNFRKEFIGTKFSI